ncbi:MAG: WbqC family protein [Chitinophagaceae bacterium]|nr:WbqC family protein [Chitinophagaceae bacterium]
MILLTDNQYLASFIYYKILINASYIELEQYENWQKMSFRNRCLIAGANGVLSLSVPVAGGRNVNLVVKEVKIDNMQNWQAIHWRSIFSAYNRSPWFEFYRDELELFYTRKFTFLWDWNLELMNWVLQKMKMDIPVHFSGHYRKQVTGDDIIDMRNKIVPRDLPHFNTDCPPYNQVFVSRHGFIPNLSIIDLLFCEGKNALNILKATPLSDAVTGMEKR